MSSETVVSIANGKDVEMEHALFLGKDFTWEISLGYLFHEKIYLSKDEWKTLTPQNSDDIIDENPNPVNPANLLAVLDKIKNYLKDNQDTLPFEIELDYDKMEKEGLSFDITINGSRCWLQGDSNVFEVSSKVKIVNFPMEPTAVELWVNINEKIEIEGSVYYLRKVTRYDKYHKLISSITDLCELAICNNNNIYWTLWH